MPEQPIARKIETCRLTGAELAPVFDLGTPCVSDFVEPGTEGIPAPLCVAVAKEAPYLAQLTHSYPPEQMYRRYHYRSGTNEAMRAELADIARKALRLRPVRGAETFLDIACNDGTLLKQVSALESLEGRVPQLVGADPSDVAREAYDIHRHRYSLVNDFFSAQEYRRVTNEPAAVVTCVAMFYDLDDPVGFLKDVRAVLADDGLFVLQVAYTPMHVRMGAWDGICHEHVAYYDYSALCHALHLSGFGIVDAELTASNGGSIRISATPEENYARLAATVEGMAGRERCAMLADYESPDSHATIPAYDYAPSVRSAWATLASEAQCARTDLRRFLHDAKAQGKTVIGYGASTKGNGILQWCGIGPDLLPCIAERQEAKWGLVTAGSNIPIISEEEMRKMRPDYLLCLPWFFAQAFQAREADLIAGGTRLVVPLPKLTVL